jgi:hypothetical protein
MVKMVQRICGFHLQAKNKPLGRQQRHRQKTVFLERAYGEYLKGEM